MWEDVLKEDKFVIYLRKDTGKEWKKENMTFNSRDKALEKFKKITERHGYTIVGSAKEGEAVIMDKGIFVNVMHPTVYYVIMMENETPPSSNYTPDKKEQYTADTKLRQLGGDYSLPEKWDD